LKPAVALLLPLLLPALLLVIQHRTATIVLLKRKEIAQKIIVGVLDAVLNQYN
jgi:hypothetical protein